MADLDRAQVILVLNSGKNFRGVDLSDLNLSGLDFRDADLTNTNFSGSDLSNAIFGYGSHKTNQTIEGANFSNADLTGADFSSDYQHHKFCTLINVNFSNANLSNCNFMSYSKALLEYAEYASLRLNSGNLQGINFYNAILNNASFTQRMSQNIYYEVEYDYDGSRSTRTVAQDEPTLISENISFILPNGNHGDYIEQLSQFGANIERRLTQYISKPIEEKRQQQLEQLNKQRQLEKEQLKIEQQLKRNQLKSKRRGLFGR